MIKKNEKYGRFKDAYITTNKGECLVCRTKGIVEYIETLEKALEKTCSELVKMCKQTKCEDCHFVKEQFYGANNCPVQGNLTPYDWKKWSFEDER